MENATEDQIRCDERNRVAGLIEENSDTIADFASDKKAAVLLVALMTRVGDGPA